MVVKKSAQKSAPGVPFTGRDDERNGRGPAPGTGGRPPDDVVRLAKQFTVEAINTLAGIMKNPLAEASSRVRASEALLNRGWGKPEQSIIVTEMRSVFALVHADGRTETRQLAPVGETVDVH